MTATNRITLVAEDGTTTTVRYIPEPPPPVRRRYYETSRVWWLLRHYRDFLKFGRLPPTDRAVDKRARGKVEFESKPPAPASVIKCDIIRAIRALPTPRDRHLVAWYAASGSKHKVREEVGGAMDRVKEELDAAVERVGAFLRGEV